MRRLERKIVDVEGLRKDGMWMEIASGGTANQGQFRILGQTQCTQLRLTIHNVAMGMTGHGPHWLRNPVLCSPGTQGLEIPIEEAAYVSGQQPQANPDLTG